MTLNKIVVVAIVVLFAALGINNIVDNQNKLKLKNIQLKSRAAELKSLELKYDHLQIELNKTDATNKEQIKKLEEEKHKLEQERQRLEKELAVKKASKLQIAANTPLAPKTAYASPAASGSCSQWISAAGISDVASANWLIAKESGCNPHARNASSGACGVAQELPCGKSGCALGDGACQIRWMNSYVISRYGSWANAVAFHKGHNWY